MASVIDIQEGRFYRNLRKRHFDVDASVLQQKMLEPLFDGIDVTVQFFASQIKPPCFCPRLVFRKNRQRLELPTTPRGKNTTLENLRSMPFRGSFVLDQPTPCIDGWSLTLNMRYCGDSQRLSREMFFFFIDKHTTMPRFLRLFHKSNEARRKDGE